MSKRKQVTQEAAEQEREKQKKREKVEDWSGS